MIFVICFLAILKVCRRKVIQVWLQTNENYAIVRKSIYVYIC
jgi:hypothetical protein